MKVFWIFVGLFLVAAVAIAGCTTTSLGDIDTDKLAGDISSGISDAIAPDKLTGDTSSETSDAIAPETSGTSKSNGDWVYRTEVVIDISRRGMGYYIETPNYGQALLKDLKVTIESDGPVDLRFMTDTQIEDYVKSWRSKYRGENTSSINPQDVGYVGYFVGVTDETVEVHSDEKLQFFIESSLDKPVKGTMKIYYKP